MSRFKNLIQCLNKIQKLIPGSSRLPVKLLPVTFLVITLLLKTQELSSTSQTTLLQLPKEKFKKIKFIKSLHVRQTAVCEVQDNLQNIAQIPSFQYKTNQHQIHKQCNLAFTRIQKTKLI